MAAADGVDPGEGLRCRARDGGTRRGSVAPRLGVPCRRRASCGGASALRAEGRGRKAWVCSVTPGASLSGDVAGVHNMPYYYGTTFTPNGKQRNLHLTGQVAALHGRDECILVSSPSGVCARVAVMDLVDVSSMSRFESHLLLASSNELTMNSKIVKHRIFFKKL